MGLPYVTSLIMLINPRVGNFTSILDGAYITNMRTGAQTAIALKYLYGHNHKSKQAIKLGLYGAGMQGHTQTLAISRLFDLEEVKVYDISDTASINYKENMKDIISGEIKICRDPEEVADANVIICVTQSKGKFLRNEWVKRGTLIFPLGSYQECDDKLIINADKIIVDHIGQALHRGALAGLSRRRLITAESIFGTINDLVAGKLDISDNKGGNIVCIPIGMGALDIAIAGKVYSKAKEKGIGSSFAFV